MKGTDGTDHMLYSYLDVRKCLKPWKKVIFHVIGRMMLNAYVLYELNSVTPMSRYDFMVGVIDTLAAEELTGRNRGGGDAPGGGYVWRSSRLANKRIAQLVLAKTILRANGKDRPLNEL